MIPEKCHRCKLVDQSGLEVNRLPLTCWMPSFSTSPGGNTREANARRNISLNSVSKPPMPISSNLKLGARIAFVGALKGIVNRRR